MSVRFWCKLNCNIMQADIVFKNWVQGNKRGCTWERVVLPTHRTRSWGYSIRTHYLLCFTNFERTSPPSPGIELYRLNATLCQPLSLSYLVCPCAPSRSQNWRLCNHCFTQLMAVEPRSPFQNLFVLQENDVLVLASKSSCLKRKKS